MTRILYAIIFILLCPIQNSGPTWGFYAHKIINRMAIFILPPEMMIFYRKHIDYLSDHAPDPDKRRFSVPGEAIRHFMDIDHWGDYPHPALPRDWVDAVAKYLEIYLISSAQDTICLKTDSIHFYSDDTLLLGDHKMTYGLFKEFIRKIIVPRMTDLPLRADTDSLNRWLGIRLDSKSYSTALLTEQLSQHGINPYYIKMHYDRLVRAFRRNDARAVLRLSADLGHYVADSQVPLHATENYNGQLTGQEGIHAFWESRLPELFASEEYSYFVGKARYIKDVQAFAWKNILESNRLSRKVLSIEKELRARFRSDRQYGFDTRLDRTVRIQSRAYSRAFHDALRGMVEQRMQDAVHALGSLWFSAWVDAGQPVLDSLPTPHWTADDVREMDVLERDYRTGSEIGRSCK